MTSPSKPTVVKLNELNDIVNAVPHLLGFAPADSIVVVSMHGPRERLEFSLRLDLLPPEHDAAVAEMLAARMSHAQAEGVMVFVYTDDEPCEGVLPRRDLVDRVVDEMPMPVRDAVLVTDARTWSYLCDDERCCPSGGHPREMASPGSLALAAAHALNGRAVLPDRDAVVATVQPVTGAEAESMEHAVDVAAAAYVRQDPDDARLDARRLAEALRDRYATGHGEMADDEAALLIVAMHDWRVRDPMLEWTSTHEDAMRSLFGDLARKALPPLDAPACTVLAWAAYQGGDGLVAAIALERALDSDPEYSLAQLLEEALARQVPPSLLRWPSASG